jgi:hypothetical protein
MQRQALTTRQVRASNVTLVLALPAAPRPPASGAAAPAEGQGLATGPYQAYPGHAELRARAARVWALLSGEPRVGLREALLATKGMRAGAQGSSGLRVPLVRDGDAPGKGAPGAASQGGRRLEEAGAEAATAAAAEQQQQQQLESGWVSTAEPGQEPRQGAAQQQQQQQQQEEDHLFACGLLYMDDGETLDVGGPESVEMWYSAAAALDTSQGYLAAERAGNGTSLPPGGPLWVERVVLLGLQLPGGAAALPRLQVAVGGRPVPGSGVQYDSGSGAVTVSGLGVPVAEELRLEWWLG